MDIREVSSKKILLDGQTIYFIDSTILNKIRENPVIDNISIGSIGMINVIERKIAFAKNHKDFKFGIFKIQYPKKSYWIGELFIAHKKEWFRVRIENTRCKMCKRTWSIANPSEYSLFEFVENKEEVLYKVERLDRLKCPKCEGVLERHAIWIEEKSE